MSLECACSVGTVSAPVLQTVLSFSTSPVRSLSSEATRSTWVCVYVLHGKAASHSGNFSLVVETRNLPNVFNVLNMRMARLGLGMAVPFRRGHVHDVGRSLLSLLGWLLHHHDSRGLLLLLPALVHHHHGRLLSGLAWWLRILHGHHNCHSILVLASLAGLFSEFLNLN